jgi:hypothetical protein
MPLKLESIDHVQVTVPRPLEAIAERLTSARGLAQPVEGS